MNLVNEEKLLKMTFNNLCKYIKKNNGEVDKLYLDAAYYKAYEEASIIASSKAKKKYGLSLPLEKYENFGAEVYIAISKNFNPKKEPFDLNSFVNRVISNKLVDFIDSEMKNKTATEKLKTRININFSNNNSLIEKILIVKDGLKKIPSKCKKILYLSTQKYSIREIAVKIDPDLTDAAVRQRLRECRKKLGRMTGGFGDE